MIELSWRNYPGCTGQGQRAAEDGLEVWECPYLVNTPKHTAWIRGYLPEKRRQYEESYRIRTNMPPG